MVIYCHRNKINNKVYIGKTKNVNDRWANNGNKYKTCKKFYAAIQKYGWDNFEHIILEDNIDEDKIDERERYWIKYYDSLNNRYNLTEGGTGGDCISNLPEEKLKKLKEQHRIETLNRGEEWHKKLSEAQKKAWAEGKRVKKLNSAGSKPVRCVETGIEYPSCAEAMESIGKPRNKSFYIARVANGIRKTYNNYHWEWIKNE